VGQEGKATLLAFALLALAACSGSPTRPSTGSPASTAQPSAATTAPPSAQLTLLIDNYGSTVAIAGASSVTFDMRESTGTGLKYEVDFGDGATSSQSVSRHVYFSSRYQDFSVRATVTDQFGRSAFVDRTIHVSRLDAKPEAGLGLCPAGWDRVSSTSSRDVFRWLRFETQIGSTVTGMFDGDGRFSGTLSGDGSLAVLFDEGTAARGFVGFFVPVGMMGRYEAGHMRLTGVSGTLAGITVDFRCHDPY
jgi:hypothetical protein